MGKLLLSKPNLLLLDEPTNHLDLETRNWLEQYLLQYPFAYVLISHDRYFLDVTVNLGPLKSGISECRFYRRQLREVSGGETGTSRLVGVGLQEPARPHRAAGGVHQSLSRPGDQGQAGAKPDQGAGKDRAHRDSARRKDHPLHLSAAQSQRTTVVESADVAKSYGPKEVFRDVNFTIQRGDRIALVGVNGAGKSTLIKLLTGIEPLTEGSLKLGHNVEPDYFAQDQYKELDSSRRLLDDLSDVAPQKSITELRGVLGCFLFSEDDVFKPIGVLSGGERNRYALARMLLHPSNFLLLDEPTNHLDMRAKDVLLESLEKYNGTVVFVSHDRYFIDKLATRIFEIGEGRVEVFPGNYEDYLWRKQRQDSGDAEAEQTAWAPTLSDVPGYNGQKSQSQSKKRINPIKLKQMQERHQQLEQGIARLEEGIAECERELQSFVSAEETARWTELLAARRAELEGLMSEWEGLSQELEEAKA